VAYIYASKYIHEDTKVWQVIQEKEDNLIQKESVVLKYKPAKGKPIPD
jgi:hypothetical protein